MVSVDFLIVPTLTFHIFYVFIVLSHHHRRVLHFTITAAPLAAWTARQLREAFPFSAPPKYLLRDRDRIYGLLFQRRAEALGLEEVRIAPCSPGQSPYVEQLMSSIRRECLDHVIVLNQAHLHRLLKAYLQAVAVAGPAPCRMLNQAIAGQGLPTRLSTDQDPLFRFHRWQANLRILGVETVQNGAQVPWSHPFIERLIGTIRREYLDRLFFWKAEDLERKLESFRNYYNAARMHQVLSGATPGEKAGGPTPQPAGLENYRWQSHCHGLFELPIAA